MSDLLIAGIARRAANRDTQADMGEMARGQLAPVLRTADAEASEQALGFSVPAFLKLVYGKVGNGGFGPGYGLMGLMSGATDDQGHNAVDAYKVNSSSDPTDPAWTWPEGFLPICHWAAQSTAALIARPRGFQSSSLIQICTTNPGASASFQHSGISKAGWVHGQRE